MPKYTEDDLKIELETKEYKYGLYRTRSGYFSHWLERRYCSCYFDEKEEPQWMTDWRIESFRAWQEMTEPEWANVHYAKPDFQAISYYSAPKAVDPNKTLDDVDPELLEMYKS
jgi:Fe-S cluster assembly protein SufB